MLPRDLVTLLCAAFELSKSKLRILQGRPNCNILAWHSAIKSKFIKKGSAMNKYFAQHLVDSFIKKCLSLIGDNCCYTHAFAAHGF